MVAKVTTRERPILFGGEMVKAIFENRKCQTRRVMKDQPPDDDFDVGFYHPTLVDRRADGWEEYPGDEVFGAFSKDGSWGIKSPFVPGMTLWVRETFCPYRKGLACSMLSGTPSEGVLYKATDKKPDNLKWKPSIFMPRWASRLTLEVTEVRMQRVWDISEKDARAEGCDVGCRSVGCDCARQKFVELWNSINRKRNGGKYSWEANPYVRAVTFKRVDNGR